MQKFGSDDAQCCIIRNIIGGGRHRLVGFMVGEE